MASFISITFDRHAVLMDLFRPTCSLLPIVNIFLYAIVYVTSRGAASTSFIVFGRVTILLKLFRCPILSFLAFVLCLHACCVLMTIHLGFHCVYVIRGAKIDRRGRVFRAMFTCGLICHQRRHIAFVFITLVGTVNGQVTTRTCGWTRCSLEVAISSLFQGTDLTWFILVVHFGMGYNSVVR